MAHYTICPLHISYFRFQMIFEWCKLIVIFHRGQNGNVVDGIVPWSLASQYYGHYGSNSAPSWLWNTVCSKFMFALPAVLFLGFAQWLWNSFNIKFNQWKIRTLFFNNMCLRCSGMGVRNELYFAQQPFPLQVVLACWQTFSNPNGAWNTATISAPQNDHNKNEAQGICQQGGSDLWLPWQLWE